mmetsp:Transcript_9976/g.24842  ORF Transcript_9976/g.24842 Transcript_9976/m.24842 type:complete len:256 (+) Transcript_9976:209-976(+)
MWRKAPDLDLLQDQAAKLRGAERVLLGQDDPPGLLPLRTLEHLQRPRRRQVAVPRARDEDQEPLLLQQRPCDEEAALCWRPRERPADDSSAEGIGREAADFARDTMSEAEAVLRGGVLQKVLHNVVSEGVPRHGSKVCNHSLDEREGLRGRAMLDEALEDAAAELVLRSLLGATAHHLIDDKLQRLWVQYGRALLHDKIGMRTAQCIPNMPSKLRGQCLSDLHAGLLQHALNFTTARCLLRELPNPSRDTGRNIG